MGNKASNGFLKETTDQQNARENEERFLAAMNAIEGVLWTNTAEGRMEGNQPGWSKLTGQSHSEYHGYGWANAVHPDDAQASVDAWEEAVRDRKMFIFEHRVKRADGVYRLFSIRAIPLFNNDGTLREWVGVHTDITDKRLAEEKIRESEHRFQRLIRDTSVAIIVLTGREMKVELVNEAYGRLIGRTPQELLNTSLFDVIPEAESFYRPILEKVLLTGESIVLEETPYSVFADGKPLEGFLHAVYQPYRDEAGNSLGVIAVLQDVTESVNARRELEALSTRLEQTVAQRTAELQRSNDDLAQFAHVASHDLKEPVRKVKVFGDRLRTTIKEKNDAQAMLFLDKIDSATDRIYAMINGVLAYSAYTGSTAKSDRVDLQEVIREIQSDLEVMIAQKKATILYNNLGSIQSDPVPIYQLLYNLISNALKFSRPQHPPVITVNATRTAEGLLLTVSDNGIGFDNNNAEFIFRIFSRLNAKDKFEGTGLGLSLCKKIVERLGGTITASGTPGVGATFTVILPSV